MHKKILGTLFALLFAGMGLFMYKLLNQSIEVKMDVAKEQSSIPPAESPLSAQKEWVKELAHKDAREFIFPVNELFMQIDLHGISGDKVKTYRLVIDRIDRYSVFCVVQTLSALRLSYMVVKEEKAPFIYVQEKSEKALEKVVVELEKYDIKSKIVEVWL